MSTYSGGTSAIARIGIVLPTIARIGIVFAREQLSIPQGDRRNVLVRETDEESKACVVLVGIVVAADVARHDCSMKFLVVLDFRA